MEATAEEGLNGADEAAGGTYAFAEVPEVRAAEGREGIAEVKTSEGGPGRGGRGGKEVSLNVEEYV